MTTTNDPASAADDFERRADSPSAGPAPQSDVSSSTADGVDELPEFEPLTPELVEDEAIRGDFVLRWAVVLLALLMACTEITKTRTLIHVKTGQYIASHGMLPPRNDVFSYTATDRPWINTSWLFDLITAAVYGVGGAVGLSLMQAIIAAIAFGLVVHTSRRGVSTWWGSITAALALLVCLNQFQVLPELITLLGVAWELWLLERWRERGQPRELWLLCVLFLFWGNLDPRMFVGLGLLVLYALGQTVGRLLGRAGHVNQAQFKQLWLTVGACVVAAIINPFGWNTLIAPWTLYAVEYPAIRELVGNATSPDQVQFFPMVSREFWNAFSYHTLAGIMLGVAVLISLALNWDEVDWGHVLVFLGAAAIAMAAGHELAPAAIVFAVIAALNAQAWYRRSFRQTYSVETAELLFSRGGRAVTVLALAVVAYLAISGHIGGSALRRTGLGWHGSLQAAIDGVTEETRDAYDDKPFNVFIPQGDVLIWADQRVFVDSRLALYRGKGDDDLIELHRRMNKALAIPALKESDPAKRTKELETKLDENRKAWRQTFDEYGISHVLVDLSERNPDNYELFLALIKLPSDWQQTHMGAMSSAFYRRDLAESDLKKFRSAHLVNPIETAFRTEAEKLEVRGEWARARSFYDKYLSLPKDDKPNAIRKAEHYALLLRADEAGELGMLPEVAAAVAYLAIQNANVGLSQNPQDPDGFRALAAAYEYLDRLEFAVARSQGGRYNPQRRWSQAIAAYNQAVKIDPDHGVTHLMLYAFYAKRQKLDLALRELEEYERLTSGQRGSGDIQARRAEQITREGDALRSRRDTITNWANDMLAKNADRLQISQEAARNGFGLLAREVLENDTQYLNQTPPAQLLQARLLMEAGEHERAVETLERFEGPATQYGNTDWRVPTAQAWLGNGDYARALDLLNKETKDIEKRCLTAVLGSLPLITPPLSDEARPVDYAWPQIQVRAAVASLFQLPDQAAQGFFEIALCHLEAGQPKQASEALHKVLKSDPETKLRPLAVFYLFLAAEEQVDELPPSERIPVTDIFTEEAGAGDVKTPIDAPKPDGPTEK
ncbi:MAG: tetratricopeptide repeat protein [Planctomycetaceae bacterium]